MARVKLNPVLEAIRGKVGDLVFKRYGEEVVVTRTPNLSGLDPTPGQQAVRSRFKLAALYGKTALADPQSKALYGAVAREKGLPLFALAVADFFHEPAVQEVDLSAYSGKAGERIGIQASDDFEVTGVEVAIRNAEGAVLEKGPAARNGSDSAWTYTTTTEIPSGQSVSIEVTATDRPGHKGVKVETKA